MANAFATSASVPLGDVLVYDAQAVDVNGNACITVTMRFTGVDGEDNLSGMPTEEKCATSHTSHLPALSLPTLQSTQQTEMLSQCSRLLMEGLLASTAPECVSGCSTVDL